MQGGRHTSARWLTAAHGGCREQGRPDVARAGVCMEMRVARAEVRSPHLALWWRACVERLALDERLKMTCKVHNQMAHAYKNEEMTAPHAVPSLLCHGTRGFVRRVGLRSSSKGAPPNSLQRRCLQCAKQLSESDALQPLPTSASQWRGRLSTAEANVRAHREAAPIASLVCAV